MSMGELPYKSVHLVTKKEFEPLKDDILEVIEARHHLKGYTGHIHAKQVGPFQKKQSLPSISHTRDCDPVTCCISRVTRLDLLMSRNQVLLQIGF